MIQVNSRGDAVGILGPQETGDAMTSITGAAPTPNEEARAGAIEQSHLRCEALGLKRIERPDFEPLVRSDLAVARERNQRLFTHAAPVMELLFEQIVDTESMIVLTDAQGTILHSVGDDRFLHRAGKVALSPGVNWAEHAKGTNAIGTALVEEAPTVVHGGEHFIHANNFLTCSAAPIFDPRGNMLGVLDVTGDQRSYHQHTMGAGAHVGAHDREPVALRRLRRSPAPALPQPRRIHRHAARRHRRGRRATAASSAPTAARSTSSA